MSQKETVQEQSMCEFLLEKFPGAFTVIPEGTLSWKQIPGRTVGDETVLFNYNHSVEPETIMAAIVDFYEQQGYKVTTNAVGGYANRQSDWSIRAFVLTTQERLRITIEV